MAETGVAANVAAAVGGTADKGKKGAVSLLAEALKGAASAEAATPAPFILDEGMTIPGKSGGTYCVQAVCGHGGASGGEPRPGGHTEGGQSVE